MKLLFFTQLCVLLVVPTISQSARRVGRLEEVFSWKQISYDINGVILSSDRATEDNIGARSKREDSADDNVQFDDHDASERSWTRSPNQLYLQTTTAASVDPNDERGRFYIQYNNVPMGAERVGNRLFVTVPRRRFGIPSTLNYIDLNKYSSGSPPLTPYPSMLASRSVISVYRTRADACGRLWALDTGAIEIPNNIMYIQRPAILVYDLNTDKLIVRYELKPADLPATNTPTGLASITIEIRNNDCSDTYAYVPDLVSYGLVVYSLKENNSWRHTHNYYSFVPTAGDLRISGQSFQWNDGIFSITLGRADASGCRPAFFHPMISFQEFEISTCELHKRQANRTAYRIVGERGDNSQSTMHDHHDGTNVIFFADVGRDAVSCWNVDKPLTRDNVAVLARDAESLSYPSDLHVTGDEVWVTANQLPRFAYSRLDPNKYNFFIYKANVQDLISGTACEPQRSYQMSPFNQPNRGYY